MSVTRQGGFIHIYNICQSTLNLKVFHFVILDAHDAYILYVHS